MLFWWQILNVLINGFFFFLAPHNGFSVMGQNESSITLQWPKMNNSVSFVLHFNGTETNISASSADGPVTYTVSSLSPGTTYTFILFHIFENVRISQLQLQAVTGKILQMYV